MALFQAEEKERLRRERTKEAISLATKSRWQEAESINRLIVQEFPNDVEAYNRLGKALAELGRYSEAKDIFKRSLEMSPSNSIAKKNLMRLANLQDEPPTKTKSAAKVTHHLYSNFIEESGKAGIVSLTNLAPKKTIAKMAAGEVVQLHVTGKKLMVKNSHNEYLGEVGPKVAIRLVRLIDGGNRYEATVTRVREGAMAVMIREVYKHPSLASVVSFPSKVGEETKSYVGSNLLRYDLDLADEEQPEGGEEETEKVEKYTSSDWADSDQDMEADENDERPSIESSGFHEVSTDELPLTSEDSEEE